MRRLIALGALAILLQGCGTYYEVRPEKLDQAATLRGSILPPASGAGPEYFILIRAIDGIDVKRRGIFLRDQTALIPIEAGEHAVVLEFSAFEDGLQHLARVLVRGQFEPKQAYAATGKAGFDRVRMWIESADSGEKITEQREAARQIVNTGTSFLPVFIPK